MGVFGSCMCVGVVLSSQGGSCHGCGDEPGESELMHRQCATSTAFSKSCQFRVPGTQNFPAKPHDTPPLLSNFPPPRFRNMAAQVASGGGGAGNAAFKVWVPMPQALKTLTDGDYRTRKSPGQSAAPTSLQPEVCQPCLYIQFLQADPECIAVADAIRTVCPPTTTTTMCGQPNEY